MSFVPPAPGTKGVCGHGHGKKHYQLCCVMVIVCCAFRYLFTGHTNGSLQVWDLTTALDLYNKQETVGEAPGGPTPNDLLSMLDFCDISSSRHTTPSVSPSPSLIRGLSSSKNSLLYKSVQQINNQGL